MRAFQAAAVVAVAVPLLLALAAEGVGVARAVGLAFAVAASTFCPLLVLGIWWRRLTDVGAVAGLSSAGCCPAAPWSRTLLDDSTRLARRAPRAAGGVVGAGRVPTMIGRLAR